VSQHYFFSITQQATECIADFVANLQHDIADCEFTVLSKCTCVEEQSVSVAELCLRIQFIRGLRDNWIREKILQSTHTKFADIVTSAIALEASKIESKEIAFPNPASNPVVPEINKF